jgi:hypothetical protein
MQSIPFKALLVASPFVASVFWSPAQAAALTKTFTGFTDAFAPAQWNQTTYGESAANGKVAMNSSTATVKANNNATAVPGQPKAGGRFNTKGLQYLDAFAGPGAPAGQSYRFTDGTAKFNLNYFFRNGQIADGSAYSMNSLLNKTPTLLNTYKGTGAIDNLNSYNAFNPNITINLSRNDNFGFELIAQALGTDVGEASLTASNFSFVANYALVPGPLPAAAAVAGFGWSRRIRRRLRSAAVQA